MIGCTQYANELARATKTRGATQAKQTPNRVTNWPIQTKIHAKSGYKYTPNQAKNTRQIRIKVHAKSSSIYLAKRDWKRLQSRFEKYAA